MHQQHNNFRIGIELEVLVPYEHLDDVCNEIDNSDLPFACGDDSSINGDGESIEIRSTTPLTYQQVRTTIPRIADILQKYHVFINKTCGFHLHISHPMFFSKHSLKRMIILWVAIEDILLATQPPSRLNNNYCKRYLVKFLQDKKNKKDIPEGKEHLLNELSESNVSRYYTLNLAALKKHGTIEIRLHAGTTKAVKILFWVELMLALFTYVLTRYKNKSVMDLFYQPISDEKIAKAYALLHLPEEVGAYYTKRIQTNLFKTLALQQEHAQKNYRLANSISKAEENYTKIREKLQTITNAWEDSEAVLQQGQTEAERSIL